MGAKGRVALGALPLAGLVAAAHTLEAEHVEALGKDSILLAGVTAGAGQPRLGRAKVSAQAQPCPCPDPKLTAGGRAKPPQGAKHLTLAITLGEDEPPPRGSRDSEATRKPRLRGRTRSSTAHVDPNRTALGRGHVSLSRPRTHRLSLGCSALGLHHFPLWPPLEEPQSCFQPTVYSAGHGSAMRNRLCPPSTGPISGAARDPAVGPWRSPQSPVPS